jgi:hypothetical protein
VHEAPEGRATVNCCVDEYVPLSKAVVPFSSVAVPFSVLAEAGNTPSEMPANTTVVGSATLMSRGAILLFIVKPFDWSGKIFFIRRTG